MIRLGPSPRTRQARAGVLGFWLLFTMPVVLMLVYVAINAWLLYEARINQQNATDASALAATQMLIDDRLLVNEIAGIDSLMVDARAGAQAILDENPYAPSTSLQLMEHDLIFGILDKPNDKVFTGLDPTAPDDTIKVDINSVRVTTYRTKVRGNPVPLLFGPLFLNPFADLKTAATATLDKFVVGFQAVGNANIPLAPFAIFSDVAAGDSKSWEYQVENAGTRTNDNYKREADGSFTFGMSDSLFEFRGILGHSTYSDMTKVNVVRLQIGQVNTTVIDHLCGQLQNGITKDQLGYFITNVNGGNPFILGSASHELEVPGSMVGPDPGTDMDDLFDCLEALSNSGSPRVWPVYDGFNGSGYPVLTGFIAARVVLVETVMDTMDGGMGMVDTLQFILQPCMMSTQSAVTDSTRTDVSGYRNYLNPYLSRVRVVE